MAQAGKTPRRASQARRAEGGKGEQRLKRSTPAARRKLIRDLEKARGGDRKVIAYVTNTRLGYHAPMANDVIPIIHEHLRALSGSQKLDIDLFLHTDGGSITVPWRLMTLLREFIDAEVAVLVPHHAYSAGTLTALGADRVVMHPMGMLGPTDPVVNTPFNPEDPGSPGNTLGINVEDVGSYISFVKEDVGITHEDELVQAFTALAREVHPLALGSVKRTVLQSKLLGKRMLKSRREELGDHVIDEIVDKLTTKLYYHGHPINRIEARDEIGLDFVEDSTPEVGTAMWALYESYVESMRLTDPFDFLMEGIAAHGSAPSAPAAPTQVGPGVPLPAPNIITARPPVIPSVCVESTARSDSRELELEITLAREWNGRLSARYVALADEWRKR
jgi:Serine dehydrogenase proteinase